MAAEQTSKRATNLPAETTSFVGRRRELRDIKRLLASARLVTVTGPGGVGKTRVALRAARHLARVHPDGCRVVDLSPLTEPRLVAHAVGQALGLTDQTARRPVDLLVRHLADKRLLLILDTCEHLLAACAELAETLLRAAPRLSILATSRQPLGAAGEHTLPIAPLPVAEEETDTDTGREAVTLFAERAAAVVPGWTLTPDNTPAVAELCRRLEGIPLAIELAAVHLRALSVPQIVARLDSRLRLLGSGSRTSVIRHQTLRTTIGWSHELCTPAERRLWARLSVFVGSFDLEAVEHICTDAGEADEPTDETVYEVLTALVEKSIVLRADSDTTGGATVRYRLLDTLREYGAEWLRQSGDEEHTRRRHRDWFLGLAEQWEIRWIGAGQEGIAAAARVEHHNFRAALEFCADTPGEVRTGLRLADALWFHWIGNGLSGEGCLWLDRILALDTAASPERVLALRTACHLQCARGEPEAARLLAIRALTAARQLGDPTLESYAAQMVGVCAVLRGDLAVGVELLTEAVAHFEAVASLDCHALLARVHLALALSLTGQSELAAARATTAIAVCTAHGERWVAAYAQFVLATDAWSRADPATGMELARDCLRTSREFNDPLQVLLLLELIAAFLVMPTNRDDAALRAAAAIQGAAGRLWGTVGVPRLGSRDMSAPHEQCESTVRRILGDEVYAAAARHGETLDLPGAVSLALGDVPAPTPAATTRTPGSASGAWTPLTPRERQVAELIADGLSNRDVAARLVIAKRTVDSHVEHILAKLGFSARTQIAAWVAERQVGGPGGLFPPGRRARTMARIPPPA